jgi:hypothetical protein
MHLQLCGRRLHRSCSTASRMLSNPSFGTTRHSSRLAPNPGQEIQSDPDGEARKLKSDGSGVETPMPMNDFIDVGLFTYKKSLRCIVSFSAMSACLVDSSLNLLFMAVAPFGRPRWCGEDFRRDLQVRTTIFPPALFSSIRRWASTISSK